MTAMTTIRVAAEDVVDESLPLSLDAPPVPPPLDPRCAAPTRLHSTSHVEPGQLAPLSCPVLQVVPGDASGAVGQSVRLTTRAAGTLNPEHGLSKAKPAYTNCFCH